MDKKEQIEKAAKHRAEFLKFRLEEDAKFYEECFIEGAEWALSQPKEVEPKKEVDLNEIDEDINLEHQVLLYLQGYDYQFSGDSVNGYPFVSKIDEIAEINLQGVLEDFAEDLINGLPHLQKPVESEWISVEDRLPNVEATYLVTLKSETDTWIETAYLFNGVFSLGGHRTTDKITHWMPLPQPPKPNSNN